MGSRLLKPVLLATVALAFGAMASATQAKTYAFTFSTDYGGEFCDGLTLTTADKITYSGTHTGSCLDGTNYAGGFATTIKGIGKYIDISTTDNLDLPGQSATFLLNLKAKTWFLYVNYDGAGFQLLNEGKLIDGAPPIGKHGARSSVFKNPKAMVKPF